MGNQQEWKDTGEKIVQSVSDAIMTGDFTKVNRVVRDVVTNVVDEAQQNLDFDWRSYQDRIHENELHRQRQWQEQAVKRREQTTQRAAQASMVRQVYQSRPLTAWRKFKAKKIGSVSSVLYKVFGGIGLSVFIPFFLAFSALFIAGEVGIAAPITSGLILAVFCGMIGLGISQKKRLARAERYMNLCGDNMYATIKDIAIHVGKSERYVRKDIQKMINLGIFPEGHIDEWGTNFMLSDEIYEQYRSTNEEFKRRTMVTQVTGQEPAQKGLSELEQMIAEGEHCVAHLRELNSEIPDETITADLNKLDGLLHEIFARVKEHPEQMSRMHKVMDYYLPTTIKLVEAYAEFDDVSVPGQDINQAKKEIEKTLGIINESFAELLNNLFQDAAFDVTADAQVLQSMLSREGLAKEPAFATMKGGEE